MSGTTQASFEAALADLEPRLSSTNLDTADELFAVVDLFENSAGMRRAISDATRPVEQRVELVQRVLGDRIGEQALQTVKTVVQSRWARERDPADALESLAAVVAAADAERDGGREGLRRLDNDLFAFIDVVDSSHDLQRALDDPQANLEAKERLAARLVPNASEPARTLIQRAVRNPRGLKPVALVRRFTEIVARREQRWIAEVTVSRPLTDEQARRLEAGLNALYERDLQINTRQDAELIGGIRVKVGDEVVDASVMTRLHEVSRKLAV